MPDKIEHIALAPLFNFDIEEELQTSEFTIIKPQTKEQLEKNFGLNFEYIDELERIHWTQCPIFVKRILSPVNSGDIDFAETQKILNHFYNILVLFKPWSLVPLLIGPFYLMRFVNGTYVGSHRGGYVPTNHTSPNPDQEKVVLLKSEFDAFRSFFTKLYPVFQKYTSKNMLDRAILANYWVSKLRENIKPYDRLIFLVTALEALISQNENELNYRISHRTATLLGETELEKSTIFQSIKEYYNLRSKIVHGTPQEEVKFYETWYLQEIVRSLILKFISLYENGFKDSQKFLKQLDIAIFDSSLRKEIVDKSNAMFGDSSKVQLYVKK